MGKRDVGIYEKFTIRRTDGKDQPGCKHENCQYFVLDIDHDEFALPALIAYAEACSSEYPFLSSDLKSLIKLKQDKSTIEDKKNES